MHDRSYDDHQLDLGLRIEDNACNVIQFASAILGRLLFAMSGITLTGRQNPWNRKTRVVFGSPTSFLECVGFREKGSSCGLTRTRTSAEGIG